MSRTLPDLAEYQNRFVVNVGACVGANWMRRRPRIRVLDIGCDPAGRQLRQLKQLTRGEVVGVNIAAGFPSKAAVEAAGPGVTIVHMDGTHLRFPDDSFDLVVSANVAEHIADLEAYLRECARVLKANGVAYIESAPVWTSARGHHIMESMIAADCPGERNYRDDGGVIPEWSHLYLDEAEMMAVLRRSLRPETCKYILSILYHSTVLNKVRWSSMLGCLERCFPYVVIRTWPLPGIRQEARPGDGREDYDVYGFSLVGRQRPQNGVARRLFWRLRRFGC